MHYDLVGIRFSNKGDVPPRIALIDRMTNNNKNLKEDVMAGVMGLYILFLIFLIVGVALIMTLIDLRRKNRCLDTIERMTRSETNRSPQRKK
jgi:heme/copper-type cytochrome/quinol oxidase subunit 2